MRENPDHVIIHIGTNDLALNTPAEKVAESIIDLASTLKSDSCSVAISSITVRNDKHRNKVAQVNHYLKRLCQENNFELINHENTITERHLNGSKLHLNKRGTAILSNNFTEAVSNSIQRQLIFHSLNNRRNSGKFVTDEYEIKVFDGDSNLKSLRRRNFNKLVLGHLNINSLRNKFDALTQQIKGNVDILMLSETKLDSSYPEGQFLIPGCGAPYRIDRTCHRGGIMLFVREDITSKLLLIENAAIEGFYIKIKLRKKVANLWFL